MKVQTFTEFVGELPDFDSYRAKWKYVKSKQEEYFSIHKEPEEVNRALFAVYEARTDLHLKSLSHDSLDELEEAQREEYLRAMQVFQTAVCNNRLRLKDLQGTTLDFGCGYGGSSIFLNLQSNQVYAAELKAKKTDALRKSGHFPEERILKGDGLMHMLELAQPEYDLICALGLGVCDTPWKFLQRFYQGIKRALKPEGRVVVESDLLTMDKVRHLFDVPCPPYDAVVVVI